VDEVQAATYLAEGARNAGCLAVRVSLRDEDDDRSGENRRIGWHFREARVEQETVPNTLVDVSRGLVDVLTTGTLRMFLTSLAACVSAADCNSAEISFVTGRRCSAVAAVRHDSGQGLDANYHETTGVGGEIRARRASMGSRQIVAAPPVLRCESRPRRAPAEPIRTSCEGDPRPIGAQETGMRCNGCRFWESHCI
jgi:hypothetical protein